MANHINPKQDKKRQRICSGQQFRKIYQEGQRFSAPFFTVFTRPNETQVIRLGITVTRKVGNAVVRNRCKRRVRAVFAEMLKQREVAALDLGLDLVVNVKTELIKADFSNLVEAFGRTLTRAESFWRKRLTEQAAPGEVVK